MYPVLFVHGFLDVPARFNKMQRVLKSAGSEDTFAMRIRPANTSISIEAMGAQVEVAADQLLKTSGAPKLDIVAYSMGGLAARYFIQRLSGAGVVRRYVSLSAPHHGTQMAYLLPTVGSRQMRPDSTLLRALNADRASWGGVEVYSLWTRFDLMVFPATSSILEWAQNREFGVPIHQLMLTDDKVIRGIIAILAEGGKSVPSGSKISA